MYNYDMYVKYQNKYIFEIYKNQPSFIWPLPIGPIIVERSDPELERSLFSTSPTRDRSFESLSFENVRHSLKTLKKIYYNHMKIWYENIEKLCYKKLQKNLPTSMTLSPTTRPHSVQIMSPAR